jgi:hypothetical protein
MRDAFLMRCIYWCIWQMAKQFGEWQSNLAKGKAIYNGFDQLLNGQLLFFVK